MNADPDWINDDNEAPPDLFQAARDGASIIEELRKEGLSVELDTIKKQPIVTDGEKILRNKIAPEDEANVSKALQQIGPKGKLMIRPISEYQCEHVRWLMPGFIIEHSLNLVVGDPDCGKTAICLDLAARLTHGEPLPGCDRQSAKSPAVVVYVGSENRIETVVKPRLRAAGADETRVYHVDVMPDATSEVDLVADVSEFNDLLEQVRENYSDDTPIILIADPLQGHLSLSDGNKAEEVRPKLIALSRWCESARVTVLAIKHTNKESADSVTLNRRLAGSAAWLEVPRCIIGVGEHPEIDDEPVTLPDGRQAPVRVFAVCKQNDGKSRNLALRFTLAGCPDPEIDAPVVVWGDSVWLHDAGQLGARARPTEFSTKLAKCMAYIKQEIELNGPLPRAEIVSQCKQRFDASESTTKRAIESLGYITGKRVFSGPSWVYAPGQSLDADPVENEAICDANGPTARTDE